MKSAIIRIFTCCYWCLPSYKCNIEWITDQSSKYTTEGRQPYFLFYTDILALLFQFLNCPRIGP